MNPTGLAANQPNKNRWQQQAGPVVQTTPRLSIEQRRHLIACLLADELLFSTARVRLKPELMYEPAELSYKAIWATALKLVEQFGTSFLFKDRMQAWQSLDTEAKVLFRERPDLWPVLHWDAAFGETGFLSWFYGQCQVNEFSPVYGQRLLADFLRERAISDPWHRLSRETSESVVVNLPQMYQQLVDTERDLCALGSDPVRSGAPAGWVPPVVTRKTTKIRWLDNFLLGGHRPGETYLVAGANGAGKTTLALQIAQGVADHELLLGSGNLMLSEKGLKSIGWDPAVPYIAKHAYYFHYEMSEDDIRNKLWSSAAMIDYDRLVNMCVPGFELKSGANLSDFDSALLRTAIEQTGVAASHFLSEIARLEMAKQRLSQNFWQIDCSGAIPGVGTGYVPEIAAILAAEVKKGRWPAVVVIDYASACVERHSSNQEDHYHLLAQFGRRLEQEIAVPFQTPVWLLQQLSGESNRRTPGSKQNHADTRGCKSMGDACWFAFSIGTGDEKTGCRYFTCSKARRSGLGTPPVLKIAGGYNRLIDVSSQFSFDRVGRVVDNQAIVEAQKAEEARKAEEAKNAKACDTAPPTNDPVAFTSAKEAS